MKRKFMIVIALLGIGVVVILSSGTFFAAREAKDFLTAEVGKARNEHCEALRADFRERWNRAIDSGQLEEAEDKLAAMEDDIKAKCGRT